MSQNIVALDLFQSELRAASTEEQLLDIIDRLDGLTTNDESSDDYDRLRLAAFLELVETTKRSQEGAQQSLVGRLLPLCVQSPDEAPTASYRAARYRDVLVSWLGAYNWPMRAVVRDAALKTLLGYLQGSSAEGASWTVAQIGYRVTDITDRLWNLVMTCDDRAGDAALAALTTVEDLSVARVRIRDIAHGRMSNRFSMGLMRTIQRLADPASIEPIRHSGWFESSAEDGGVEYGSLALRLLIDIADAHWRDAELQNHLWDVVAESISQHSTSLDSSLYLGSDVAPRCDSTGAMATLLRAYAHNSDATERSAHRHYLLCLRLGECVRPTQLAAWSKIDIPEAESLLLQDARRDTHAEGRWLSQEARLKEAAWNVLLCLGNSQLLADVDPILRGETNAFMQSTICDIVACFRLEVLPPVIHEWVTDRHDAKRNGSSMDWAARMAAIRVARSIASRDAFDALLHFGFSMDGRVLRQSVEALADVGIVMAQAGHIEVADALIETAILGGESTHRTAAIGALPTLAGKGLLSAPNVTAVVSLLGDGTLTPLEQSLIVETIGYVGSRLLTSDAISRLHTLAMSDSENLPWRAMEAMARQNILIEYPDIIESRLGIEWNGDRWRIKPGGQTSDWNGYLIGLLYRSNRRAFGPVVIALLRDGDWQTAAQIAGVLRSIYEHSPRTAAPRAIAHALLDRIRSGQRHTAMETEMFDLAASIAPDALGAEQWQDVWDDWRPEARAALAEALGSCSYSAKISRTRATKLLAFLTQDGLYGVRRSAYRGLLRQSPRSLATMVAAWQSSQDVLLRERAAEALGWLEAEPPLHEAVIRLGLLLQADPEPTVREALANALSDHRERLWARDSVARVRAASSGTNEAILGAWPYGQALLQIGDDECIQILRDSLGDDSVPLHVTHWWQQLIEGMESHWQKTIEKWPDLWHRWEGVMEEGEGAINVNDGVTIPVHYRLWYQPAVTISDVGSWSGTAESTDTFPHIPLGSECILRLDDSRQGTVLILNTSISSSQGQSFAFTGQRNFPS